MAEMPLEVALLETEAQSKYQQLAEKARHLRDLGLSYRAIARKLEVDDKTVAKSVWWLESILP